MDTMDNILKAAMQAAFDEVNKEFGEVEITASEFVEMACAATEHVLGELKEQGMKEDGIEATKDLLNLHSATLAAVLFSNKTKANAEA